LLLIVSSPAAAQEETQSGPVYIVQPGDTLWDIAARFGITPEELTETNNLIDPSQLNAGDHLVIPGLEGIQGVLTTEEVSFGESIQSLSMSYGIPIELLTRLNRITSPIELYVGSSLIIPQEREGLSYGKRTVLAQGQSLLELAITQGTSMWELTSMNRLEGSWAAIPGEVIYTTGEDDPGPTALPPQMAGAVISPTFPVQGKAAVLALDAAKLESIRGSWMDHELHFVREDSETFTAMQGVHALAPPGLYPLTIQGLLTDGTPFHFKQSVYIQDGEYVFDPVLYVDPATIDPQVTKPEDAQWTALAAPATSDKLWEGVFSPPVDPVYADCWPSRYGSRRSYNESAYIYFHTGLDFCGGVGDAIYAPEAGVVVFAGQLSVRGNATMIDHGWGVYSGFMHQSEILGNEGDIVEKGQPIGRIGATGRVTGPHLHWEVFVGGVQVNPLDWLLRVYP
jgi:murein DD-endopeptidase MepM/ murein hydrolase activator NlpD